jgi:phosphoribosylamine--glycine ligase
MMAEHKFGKSGEQVVIEEFLEGPEVSVLAFTDGKTIVPMVSSMDHKRALDGDQGLNTGGMGTVAPNPYYTPDVAKRCMDEIFLPTVRAMNAEGRPFKGCLYFGLMVTKDGPKVIEYNCRFGDPETQVVLPLLESDLFTIMQAVTRERLADVEVKFKDASACCVILASKGYPQSYDKGFPLEIPEELRELGGNHPTPVLLIYLGWLLTGAVLLFTLILIIRLVTEYIHQFQEKKPRKTATSPSLLKKMQLYGCGALSPPAGPAEI